MLHDASQAGSGLSQKQKKGGEKAGYDAGGRTPSKRSKQRGTRHARRASAIRGKPRNDTTNRRKKEVHAPVHQHALINEDTTGKLAVTHTHTNARTGGLKSS